MPGSFDEIGIVIYSSCGDRRAVVNNKRFLLYTFLCLSSMGSVLGAILGIVWLFIRG
jgi:hypothetical protein